MPALLLVVNGLWLYPEGQREEAESEGLLQKAEEEEVKYVPLSHYSPTSKIKIPSFSFSSFVILSLSDLSNVEASA